MSFPSAYTLAEALGWRNAVLVFAGVILLVALPLAALGLRWLEDHRDPPPEARPDGKSGSSAALSNPVFWLIAGGFTTIGIVHGMIISHIRPILDDREIATALAVVVASMFGPMQVLGRIVMIAIESRITSMGMALTCFLGIAIGLAMLSLAAWIPFLALIFVIPYGAAYGIASIVRPVLTAEFLGRANFGAIAGMLALPYMLGFAVGPTLAALIWGAAGYDVVIVLALVLTLSGCAAILMARYKART